MTCEPPLTLDMRRLSAHTAAEGDGGDLGGTRTCYDWTIKGNGKVKRVGEGTVVDGYGI